MTFLVGSILGCGVIGVNPAHAVTFGTNIIVNPGAEAGASSATGDVVSVPGWTTTGNFTVVPYGAAGFPTPPIFTPTVGSVGSNFFAGGPNNNVSSASQTIDLSSIAGFIDSPFGVKLDLSATFGSFPEKDYPSLEIATFDANGRPRNSFPLKIEPSVNGGNGVSVGSTNLGNNKFSLVGFGLSSGTRSVVVTLRMIRDTVGSSYNNSYADNLSLVLTNNTPATAVPEPSAVPGVLIGGALVVGAMKKRRQKL